MEGPLEATVAVGRIRDLAGNYNIVPMTSDTLVYDISKPETLNLKSTSLDAFGDPLGLRYCAMVRVFVLGLGQRVSHECTWYVQTSANCQSSGPFLTSLCSAAAFCVTTSITFEGFDNFTEVVQHYCNHLPPEGAPVLLRPYVECASPVLLDMRKSPGNHSFEVRATRPLWQFCLLRLLVPALCPLHPPLSPRLVFQVMICFGA